MAGPLLRFSLYVLVALLAVLWRGACRELPESSWQWRQLERWAGVGREPAGYVPRAGLLEDLRNPVRREEALRQEEWFVPRESGAEEEGSKPVEFWQDSDADLLRWLIEQNWRLEEHRIIVLFIHLLDRGSSRTILAVLQACATDGAPEWATGFTRGARFHAMFAYAMETVAAVNAGFTTRARGWSEFDDLVDWMATGDPPSTIKPGRWHLDRSLAAWCAEHASSQRE